MHYEEFLEMRMGNGEVCRCRVSPSAVDRGSILAPPRTRTMQLKRQRLLQGRLTPRGVPRLPTGRKS